jgi:tetratricopeptide (TPR) repeat protein
MKYNYLLFKFSIILLWPFFLLENSFAQSAKDLIKGAKAQMELSQYKEAEALLSKCIETNPGNTDALELRAKCREKLFNYPAAATDYEKALQTEPGNIEYLTGAASNHYQAANYKKSAEFYSQLSGLKKNNGEIFALKARAELYQKNYKKAIEDASISITEKSSYLGYWVRAVAQDSLGKPEVRSLDSCLDEINVSWFQYRFEKFNIKCLLFLFLLP